MYKIFKAVIFFFFTLCLINCTGTQNKVGSMVDVDMNKWRVIGVIEPGLSLQDYELPVTDKNVEYYRLRIVNYNWALNVKNVRITFDDGEVWKPGIESLFYSNSASPILAIPNGPRKILKINISMENKSSLGQPIVYFFGGIQ